MDSGLEKRKFQRLEFQLEVAAEIEAAGGAPKKALPLRLKSRNLSHAGICLETESLEINPMRLLSGPPGARDYRLRMSLVLFRDEPPLEVLGEVCWYDVGRKPEGRYQLGIDFLEITDEGKDRLNRFLKEHRSGEGLFHRLFG